MTRLKELLGDLIGAVCLFAIMIAGLGWGHVAGDPYQAHWESHRTE